MNDWNRRHLNLRREMSQLLGLNAVTESVSEPAAFKADFMKRNFGSIRTLLAADISWSDTFFLTPLG